MTPHPGRVTERPSAIGRPHDPNAATGCPPGEPTGRPGILPGVVVSLTFALAARATQWLLPQASALLVAIILGAVVANTVGVSPRFAPGVSLSAKRFLRVGIVLLGLQLSLRDILGLGWPAILLAVTVVTVGILVTLAIGRALGLPPTQRLLIACGFSICGAAAIAAVGDAVDAEDEDVATGIGLVVLFGTLMIGIAPWLVTSLPLTAPQQGLVIGGSIQEVAQVVAAGGLVSGSVLSVAVIVKLARVAPLAPVILAVNLQRRRAGAGGVGGADGPDSGGSTRTRPPLVLLFVVGFVAACLLNTGVALPPAVVTAGQGLTTVLLSAAMFALGTGLTASSVRQVGARPVILGAVSTTVVLLLALGCAQLA